MNTDHLRTTLEAERDSLQAELQKLGIQNPDTPTDWIPVPQDPSSSEADTNDLGDRSEDWQEIRGTLDALETRLHNVLHALSKIEQGTYGICEVCGNNIEEARLHANPAAQTCTTHLEAGNTNS